MEGPAPLNVLVVDDEPGFRALLSWELGNRGMNVEVAKDGEEAALLARQTQFDVIITDLTMPNLDGLGLLKQVKKEGQLTEVILATGFGTVEVAVDAMKKGAFDFLLKPFDLDSLLQRIEKAAQRLRDQRICPRCGNHQ